MPVPLARLLELRDWTKNGQVSTLIWNFRLKDVKLDFKSVELDQKSVMFDVEII